MLTFTCLIVQKRTNGSGVDMALEEFAPIGALIILAIVLTFIISNISRVFGPRNPTTRKTAPYESGMQPIGPAARRFPIKFYLIAVLFILFDIEVIFFFPWAVVFRDLGIYGLAVMGLFVFILTVGLIYEWKKGALEWE
jgi:NADH-quinone oxidoreductase subunit A